MFRHLVLINLNSGGSVTCALKNWYVNLPAWLARYGRMTQKVGGIQFFITLWFIMFLGDMLLRDDGRIAGI